MADQKLLRKNRIITIGDVINKKLGDVEDLFEPTEYLGLYNEAFKGQIGIADLKGDDPIVARIARYIQKDRCDHGKPAEVLLRKKEEILKTLSPETLNRFEALFDRAKSTLK